MTFASESASTGAHSPGNKNALAYVCEGIDSLREELELVRAADGSAARLLTDLVAAATEGTAVGPILDAIHAALQESGDALGLYGRIDPDKRGSTRPVGFGLKPPAADEIVYLCPTSQCARSDWPGEGLAPRCSLTSRTLREDHL